MAVERDFRALGLPTRGMARKLLYGLGKAILIACGALAVVWFFDGAEWRKTDWLFIALGLAISYLDGTAKDKYAEYEYRLDDLERRLSELEPDPWADDLPR